MSETGICIYNFLWFSLVSILQYETLAIRIKSNLGNSSGLPFSYCLFQNYATLESGESLLVKVKDWISGCKIEHIRIVFVLMGRDKIKEIN